MDIEDVFSQLSYKIKEKKEKNIQPKKVSELFLNNLINIGHLKFSNVIIRRKIINNTCNSSLKMGNQIIESRNSSNSSSFKNDTRKNKLDLDKKESDKLESSDYCPNKHYNKRILIQKIKLFDVLEKDKNLNSEIINHTFSNTRGLPLICDQKQNLNSISFTTDTDLINDNNKLNYLQELKFLKLNRDENINKFFYESSNFLNTYTHQIKTLDSQVKNDINNNLNNISSLIKNYNDEEKNKHINNKIDFARTNPSKMHTSYSNPKINGDLINIKNNNIFQGSNANLTHFIDSIENTIKSTPYLKNDILTNTQNFKFEKGKF